ncbi:MAG: glycosyltransferase family 2 protein [Bacillota bacterium]|nr:glycosyltransferase family 2 protein [Bacillota bacterium]
MTEERAKREELGPGPGAAGAPAGCRGEPGFCGSEAGDGRREPGRVLVALPLYNEAATVGRVLAAVRRHTEADILVVDDGSTDGSGALAAGIPGVRVLSHDRNRGYGAALLSAFRWAGERGYGSLITLDCDEQHEPALIPRFLAELARGWDVVSGSRYLPQSPRRGEPPPDRVAINRAVTEIINKLTGWQLTDAFCGLKAYRVAALAKLELDEPGYGFPLQFWLQAYRHGLRVTELPVDLIYFPRERGFGGGLDDPQRRLAYYQEVIGREVARWQRSW